MNVLSDSAYHKINSASRGNRYTLEANDMELRGVSNEKLKILGKVVLPLRLGKGVPPLPLDFYVVSGFTLPTDGLIGLKTLRTLNMIIQPDTGTVSFAGKPFKTRPPDSSHFQRPLTWDTVLAHRVNTDSGRTRVA